MSQNKLAVLLKDSSNISSEVSKYYLEPLSNNQAMLKEDISVYPLPFFFNKITVKQAKEQIDKLLPKLRADGITHLYVADAAYFKVLAGQQKAEPHLGYKFPCAIKGYEDMVVTLGVNYSSIQYNPGNYDRLLLSIRTQQQILTNSFRELGKDIFHVALYPKTIEDVRLTIVDALKHSTLTMDLETFSLDPFKAGIGTLSLAWNKNCGTAFCVDVDRPTQEAMKIRQYLKQFLEHYQGKLVFHNAGFDVKVLIAQLWMKHTRDYKGMLRGLQIMKDKYHDTLGIAFVATNNAAKNSLSLKDLAHEFAGNYAVEGISDITKIPTNKLLEYNLVDALSTWFVLEKYMPVMEQDSQTEFYETMYLPSIHYIIRMELVGMPINPNKLEEVKKELEGIAAEAYRCIQNHESVKQALKIIRKDAMDLANSKLKTKQHPLSKFDSIEFNPNSSPQMQKLLYQIVGLPVISYTATKQPSVDGDTLKELKELSTEEVGYLLDHILDYLNVGKILSTFIPAFEKGIVKNDGYKYLHGSFHFGPKSGRLSSSDPNMQNLPSGSLYGKAVKSLFQAPPGWLMVGADFASLEDKINALLTQDPNKIKVYTDGYDGHCLRAFAYFPDELPGIIDTLASINSIQDLFPAVRGNSKAPTFLLTYLGTWRGLMKNCGFSEAKAKQIEARFRELYKTSFEWVANKMNQATKDGYVTLAFGLRMRTPALKNAVLNTTKTPKAAEQEVRSAGNAISGQSYGLLNNRAVIAFMKKVDEAGLSEDVLPISLIHDASYFLIRDDINVVEFVNRNLTTEMSWQELPEIQHPQVKLSAELDIYYPSWKQVITLPNDASKQDIIDLIKESQKPKE